MQRSSVLSTAVFFSFILISSLTLLGGVSNTARAFSYPFSDDMENPASGNWVLDTPWDYTTEEAYSGSYSLTDSPGDAYNNNVSISATLSQDINLSAADMPVLTFWHKYAFETNVDYGYVQVSTNSGGNWSSIYSVTGIQTGWKEERIDLTEYTTSPNVRIRFLLSSNGSVVNDGWHIDDVSIDETPVASVSFPFYDDMESGDGNWHTSTWEESSTAYNSATSLSSAETDRVLAPYVDSHLTLAGTINLGTASNPQLTFWYIPPNHGSYTVEASIYKGETYTQLPIQENARSGNWIMGQVDLSGYATSNARIRFRHHADYHGSYGWYIDDVNIDDTPKPHPGLYLASATMHDACLSWDQYVPPSVPSVEFADFDRYEVYRSKSSNVTRLNGELACTTSMIGDTSCCDGYCILEPEYYYYIMYVVDINNTYSIGSNVVKAEYTIPEVSYPFHDDMESGDANWDWGITWAITEEDAHSPTHAWSDSPYDSYSNNAATALTTSINLSAADMPVLTFWHKYAFETNVDYGYVQVSTNSGGNWPIIYSVTGIQAGWKEERIDLTEYTTVSGAIHIRFLISSNGSVVNDGWYIDDVSIDETPVPSVSFPFCDDFESGTGNWHTSTWELSQKEYFSPSTSVSSAETDRVLAPYVDSYLTLAGTINLGTAANPQLTFWYIPPNHGSYTVEASTYKGETYTQLPIENIESSGNWYKGRVSLNGYATSNARIRFRHHADYHGSYGWYIDDVCIDEDSVDWCNLESPASTATSPGNPTESIYGQVYEQGITDSTGQGAGIIAEVGYGPDGSIPPDGIPPDGWTWFNADYDSDVGDNDRYVGTITPDPGASPGHYDYCYRYRLAQSAGWRYGDLDGSDNGYLPEQAGDLHIPGSATIVIYNDKEEPYHPGEKMGVYADFSNLTDGAVLGIAGLFLVEKRKSLQCYGKCSRYMPQGYQEIGYEFYKGAPPVGVAGTYAWLGVLFSTTEGLLDYSIVVWSYETVTSTADAEKVKQIAEAYAQGLTLNTILAMDSEGVMGRDGYIIPAKARLLQNAPNPFNPETWIPYQLTEDADIVIRIYDTAGRLVRLLDLGRKSAGFYLSRNQAAYWDGKNEVGEPVASGLYFYTIQAGDFTATKKMVVTK